MPIDPELLAMLVCPGCHGELKISTEKTEGPDAEKLVCQNRDCGLKYPIRGGIPVLLISEAEGPDAVKIRYESSGPPG